MRIGDDPVSTEMQQAGGRVLLTGATGYVGGRLLRNLEASGRPVRCMVRRPEALSGRTAEETEIVRGDVLEPDSLHEPLAGVTAAYYLVHSMAASGPFADADRRGAQDFAAAARKSGVSRIVYLGGLGADDDVSTHLESRHEVGRILRESGVPTIEFRASVVIGSGSVSFEIVRSLVDRSPVLLMPRWVVSRTQPIAIEDVLAYLLAALDLELEESRLFEIGGPDRVAYADLMREYARQAGLRRTVIRVPLATPRVSGLWLSLVTPVYASIGRELIASLRNDTLVRDGSARETFPVRPRGFRQAVERALANEDHEFAETRWSDALSAHPGRNWGGVTLGQRAVASRRIRVAASPEQTFAPIQRIGGNTGWYYANGFWRLRGLMDKVVGGVGLRRGRRDPIRLVVGDTLDFWRVEAFEQNRLLRLGAEMKAPGRIWLQFEVDGDQAGATLCQTAIFDPHGLAGLAYWYTLYPVHHLIFEGMLRRIGRAAITGRELSRPTRRRRRRIEKRVAWRRRTSAGPRLRSFGADMRGTGAPGRLEGRAQVTPTAIPALLRNGAMAVAAGRVVLGLTALGWPSVPARPWVGAAADDLAVRVFGRALGARDIALGLGALTALRRPAAEHGSASAWVAAGALSDALDVIASLSSWQELPQRGRWLVIASASSAAVTGAAGALAVRPGRNDASS